jgi:hypothetical protein
LNVTAPHDSETLKVMQADFESAMAARPDALSEHLYVVAGTSVRLRIVGRGLAQEVTPPFDHLKGSVPAGNPGLTIDIWSQEETGVKGMPVTNYERGEFLSAITASPGGRYIKEERYGGLVLLDRRTSHVVGYRGSSDTLYVDERARPIQRLLSIWLDDRDFQLLHSGLVSWEGRGVLFVGKAGAGKSTSSIACLRGGFGFLGDDITWFEDAGDGSYTGHGLFASCLMTPMHLTRFPDLAHHADATKHAHDEKSLVFLSRLFSERMERSVTISVVALPRVVDSDETSFRPALNGEALLAMAPTSLMFLPGASARSLDKLSNLVERVPCYWLELGRDVDRIPDAVRRMMAAAEHP